MKEKGGAYRMEILTATMWFNSAGIMALMWLALVILFAVIEFISLGLTSIWFAAGAFVAGIVAMLGGAFWLQIVVFIVVSAVLLACTRKFAKKYLGHKNDKKLCFEIIRAALSSCADTAIIPMQDYLELDSSARINIPSTLGCNWKWRMDREALDPKLAKKIYKMAKIYSRL